jgi:hypothetical protein
MCPTRSRCMPLPHRYTAHCNDFFNLLVQKCWLLLYLVWQYAVYGGNWAYPISFSGQTLANCLSNEWEWEVNYKVNREAARIAALKYGATVKTPRGCVRQGAGVCHCRTGIKYIYI